MVRKFAWLFCACVLFSSASISAVETGETVPDVVLPTLLEEGELDLESLRGKIVYVDFWASWCPPCRISLPDLEKIRGDYAGDFEVYAINVDENREDAVNFLVENPVSYPVLSDTQGEFAARFELRGMPTSYLLDREGRVRYVHHGYRRGDDAKIRKLIEALLQEG